MLAISGCSSRPVMQCRTQKVSRRLRLVVQAAKVNDRGKVSTRPGQISQKEMKKKQQAAAAEAAAVAAAQQAASDSSSSRTSSGSSASSSEASINSSSSSGPVQQAQRSITETPQVVVDRMFKRMLGFAGMPVAFGVALLAGFYYLKVILKVDYPIWLVYVSQVLTFGGGLAGITYGVLSTSWDPSREGTFWGWTELRANLPVVMGGGRD